LQYNFSSIVMRILRQILGAAAAFSILACNADQSSMEPDAWDSLVNEFLDSTFAARPDFAVYQGRHEFDGRLPDWSNAGLAAEESRLTSWKQRLEAVDTTTLDDAARFERNYMLAVIDGDLFWLTKADWPHKNPAFYAGSLDPDVYVSRAYAPLESRMRAYTAYARNVPLAAEQIRSNLQIPLPRTYIDRGTGAFGGLASFFAEDVPKVFAGVTDEALQSEFKAANDSAIAAMKQLSAYLDSLRPTQSERFAMGPDLFREMLWATERVDTPLDELSRIARADLDRNLLALRDACAKFAPGATVEECVERVAARKPVPGPVEEARKQLTELRAFVEQKDLVTIPGPEQALVGESPPYMRWNAAYINIPGPYEENLPSTYYIAPPDPSWGAKERASYIPGVADLLAISTHEVWPGHFLQFLHANRAKSKFGQVFVGYAFAEGWAHYVEEMMIDEGLGDGDPETHIGQLLNATLRNVRFVSAIGLHTGGMTVEESERLFRDEGHQDAANARQQAARGTFDPAYLNYTLGKLMIRKLRDDWVKAHPGPDALKKFHDGFLSYGGPPIPLVRHAMLPGDKGPLF
jgi:hypothetical protein